MKREFKTAFLSYSEKQKIGEGGASDVYEVESIYKNIRFALKLLKFRDTGSEKYLRFINEFSFLVNNPHDNLVRIVDSGITDNDNYPFYIISNQSRIKTCLP